MLVAGSKSVKCRSQLKSGQLSDLYVSVLMHQLTIAVRSINFLASYLSILGARSRKVTQNHRLVKRIDQFTKAAKLNSESSLKVDTLPSKCGVFEKAHVLCPLRGILGFLKKIAKNHPVCSVDLFVRVVVCNRCMQMSPTNFKTVKVLKHVQEFIQSICLREP